MRLTHSALGLDSIGLRVTHAAVALINILWAAGKASQQYIIDEQNWEVLTDVSEAVCSTGHSQY